MQFSSWSSSRGSFPLPCSFIALYAFPLTDPSILRFLIPWTCPLLLPILLWLPPPPPHPHPTPVAPPFCISSLGSTQCPWVWFSPVILKPVYNWTGSRRCSNCQYSRCKQSHMTYRPQNATWIHAQRTSHEKERSNTNITTCVLEDKLVGWVSTCLLSYEGRQPLLPLPPPPSP